MSDLKDAWRREFKIKGQIGKIGDKENNLDFISVKRQITRGLAKGHKEPEIIEGVINCTRAGTTLRSFLQSSGDLTVETLLDILRSYFQEADTVELLQQLATAHQAPKEDPQTFLMACLDLKNRIVRYEDDDVGFSEQTVMKILLKTLESGISDDRILNSMRPFLSDPRVSDSVLIREMSHAVVLEKKRKEKSKSSPRVAVVEADESPSEAAELVKLRKQLNALQQQQDQLNALQQHQQMAGGLTSEAVEIAKLQQQLNALQQQQQQLNVMQQQQPQATGDSEQLARLQASINKLANSSKYRQYGCAACKKAGKGKTCSHCFICGASDHRVVDCPKHKKNEKQDDTLNSNRSPAGDS